MIRAFGLAALLALGGCGLQPMYAGGSSGAVASSLSAIQVAPIPERAGWLVYGTPESPYLFAQLPLPAALYGVVVFPFIWGLTEQMTYNGYLVPRFRVLCRSTSLAVALVSIVWSFQHAVMPLTFDPKFMAVRALSPLPYSVFQTLLYLRLRRLIPFAIAHALLDGASAFIGVLLPHLRT